MNCQNLFSGKNKEYIINLSSAELAKSVIKVNFHGTDSKDTLTLVLLNRDILCLCKQCRSRSVGF